MGRRNVVTDGVHEDAAYLVVPDVVSFQDVRTIVLYERYGLLLQLFVDNVVANTGYDQTFFFVRLHLLQKLVAYVFVKLI